MSLPEERFDARVTFPLNNATLPFTSRVPAVIETVCAVVPESALIYKSSFVPEPVPIVTFAVPALKDDAP